MYLARSGVDAHVDTNIGKHLSALAKTLTSLTGAEDELADETSVSVSDDDFDFSSSDDLNAWKKRQQIDLDLPAFLFDPSLNKHVVAKYLENEINEQVMAIPIRQLIRILFNKCTVYCCILFHIIEHEL